MRRASIHEQYDVGTGERLGKAKRTGTGGSASQSQRIHGAGYVGAIMGQVGYCAKKLC